MKHERKCPCCNRRATKRYRGVDLCEDCCKEMKRHKKATGVYGSIPIFSILGMTVYRDKFIPFK